MNVLGHKELRLLIRTGYRYFLKFPFSLRWFLVFTGFAALFFLSSFFLFAVGFFHSPYTYLSFVNNSDYSMQMIEIRFNGKTIKQLRLDPEGEFEHSNLSSTVADSSATLRFEICNSKVELQLQNYRSVFFSFRDNQIVFSLEPSLNLLVIAQNPFEAEDHPRYKVDEIALRDVSGKVIDCENFRSGTPHLSQGRS